MVGDSGKESRCQMMCARARRKGPDKETRVEVWRYKMENLAKQFEKNVSSGMLSELKSS